MFESQEEGLHAGEYIVKELDQNMCREQVPFVPGANPLPAGTVVALNTSTNNYVPFDENGANDTDTAVGVLFRGVPASVEPIQAVITARLSAVRGADLHFAGEPDGNEKAAAFADLATHFIIVR